jgi:calcineurin-like phosphoesterase family protein
MSNTWFTSDTHFGHAAIMRHSHRPFTTIEEHDEQLIHNWNQWVKPQDDVYFLGDFAWKKDRAIEILRRLNRAQLFFIEGNHDSAAHSVRGKFAWYDKVKMVEVEGQLIWLSHYAHRTWPQSHYGSWHLYGHSHGTLSDDPNSRSMDIGVDARDASCDSSSQIDFRNYRPFHMDEIRLVMRSKRFVPVDHHVAREASPELSPEDAV